jgi:hypothetical protein
MPTPRTLALIAIGLVPLLRLAAAQTAAPPRDAIAEAQTAKPVPSERPEQKKTAHDQSDVFASAKSAPSSAALVDQAEHGGMDSFRKAKQG